MLLVLLVSLAMSWPAVRMKKRTKEQEQAVEVTEKSGRTSDSILS
jgi:hypothetical protein